MTQRRPMTQQTAQSVRSDTGPETNVLAFPTAERPDGDLRSPPRLSERDRKRIEVLREIARLTLLRSRADLEQACRLITVERETSLRRTAMALFATLSEHGRRRHILFPPGSQEYSETEIWLCRALEAFGEADTLSGRALIGWCIAPLGQRRARFLFGRLADAFVASEVQQH